MFGTSTAPRLSFRKNVFVGASRRSTDRVTDHFLYSSVAKARRERSGEIHPICFHTPPPPPLVEA